MKRQNTFSREFLRDLARGDGVAYAIPDRDISVSYRELLDAVERWHLALASQPSTLVIYMQKSPALYDALVAAFANGWDFCPLDRANPLSRVEAIVKQFAAPLLVTDDPAATIALSTTYPVLNISSDGAIEMVGAAPSQSARNADSEPHYFIATSGSTGPPRLVAVPHAATKPFTDWAVPYYRILPGTRWIQFSSPGFDLSLVDLLSVLRGGGTLLVPTTYKERLQPATFVHEHAVTHWHSVPTMIRYLLGTRELLGRVECFSFCGEPLLRRDCQALRAVAPNARIINTYGPTEGTLFCSYYEVGANDLDDETLVSVPIGKPIAGWNHVFTRDGGGFFKLAVGGPIATGYLGVTSPLFGVIDEADDATRYFDTGDYFVCTPKGMCFSHRTDGMVKIAGNRVDIHEVANACASLGVHDVAVIPADGRLVLFVGAGPAKTSPNMIIPQLRQLLPSYAVPTRVYLVDALPRNRNGKIDRRKLAAIASRTGLVER